MSSIKKGKVSLHSNANRNQNQKSKTVNLISPIKKGKAPSHSQKPKEIKIKNLSQSKKNQPEPAFPPNSKIFFIATHFSPSFAQGRGC